jgi:hypothetical protein
MAQLTKQIILEVAERKKINPYKKPFAPRDLNINANKFGAFADYCDNTKSGRWNKRKILTAVEFNKGKRPTKYLLK